MWLFSKKVDLLVFGGSALLSMVLVFVGAQLGYLHQDTPDWAWVAGVLLVDVAHVWSTGFRVYFVPSEVKKRPALYALTPLFAWVAGVLLYSFGELAFWRCLAYLAVWHFVRQQYGWVALYRGKLRETGGRLLDTVTIYLATVYPLVYWHAHLPRKFWWFLHDDFAGVPVIFEQVLAPVYWAVMAAYFARSLRMWVKGTPNPGKDLVVLTTAVCWYTGIVWLNSDYAFTVTNVLIHGIPYMALIYYYRKRQEPSKTLGVLPFLLTLWMLAYCEELFWDRAIWHERGWLFGASWDVGTLQSLLVPLLAVPQITHYVLDGFIWKRKTMARL